MKKFKPTEYCKICGLSEWEHHNFEPLMVPDECVCDPYDWIVYCWDQGKPFEVPPVCDNFVCSLDIEDKSNLLCEACGHCYKCHHKKESK